MTLYVERVGAGPPVVFVHGAVLGRVAWDEQRPLADRWTLHLVDRPGYGDSPSVERVDFAVDAPRGAPRLAGLAGGAHLVGSSYGGVVSLLAAAEAPECVRSLTVVEPPAFAVAKDDPVVVRLLADVEGVRADESRDLRGVLAGFLGLVGSNLKLPEELPPALERGARLLRDERDPSEADISLAALTGAPFPKLVVSGGHHAAFEAVCDVLEQRLGAERAVITGAGHSVQRTGAPFNERLEAFLRSAEGSA